MLAMMGRLMRRGAAGASRSTRITAVGALLGFEALKNSINVQAVKSYYRIKQVHGVKLIKEGELRELISRRKRIQDMDSWTHCNQ